MPPRNSGYKFWLHLPEKGSTKKRELSQRAGPYFLPVASILFCPHHLSSTVQHPIYYFLPHHHFLYSPNFHCPTVDPRVFRGYKTLVNSCSDCSYLHKVKLEQVNRFWVSENVASTDTEQEKTFWGTSSYLVFPFFHLSAFYFLFLDLLANKKIWYNVVGNISFIGSHHLTNQTFIKWNRFSSTRYWPSSYLALSQNPWRSKVEYSTSSVLQKSY